MHNLFDFGTDERLFHFLADPATSGSDIAIVTPHLTDEQPPVARGVTTPVVGGTAPTGAQDPFLKNLFADNKEKKDGESLMFQSLIKSEEKNVEKKKSILGELPKIDTSLFIDKEFHLKKQLSYAKITMASLITLGFALFLFFYTQLNPNFDLTKTPNVGKTLKTTNEELKNLQTDVNFYRMSTAKKHLDVFFYNANEYLQNFDAWKTADDADKGIKLSELDAARSAVIAPFDAAREKFSKDIFVALYRDNPEEAEAILNDKTKVVDEFAMLLRDAIRVKKDAASVSAAEKRDYSELMEIVGNKSLQTLISTDLSKMTHDQLRQFILKLSGRYNHRLAFIFQIKDHRIPWFDIITEIYERTGAIDKGRFKARLYDDIGGIQYGGFDFDGTTGRITISGNVKDFDGINFTIMAGLIEELESSRRFKDVEMRNFSKNFTEKEGFEGSFKIDLSIQKYDESDPRDKGVDIEKLPGIFN